MSTISVKESGFFIYLIGFPGSGKLSTAVELSKRVGAVILSSAIFNNIIFSITEFSNSEVPDEVWSRILEVRKVMLDVIAKYPTQSKNYIFTNELLNGDIYDTQVYNSVVELSKKINTYILPVVLHCKNDELIRRIQSKERYLNRKITDPVFALKRIKEKKLFVPDGAFEIDNSELTIKEVADLILNKIEECQKN
ncbi:AAA family ATPase [Wolbachia endosymbiont of Pentidionis agamae]|uniref:AAA family ATPase n=1 Tax=Wolbachia endosymbiont of Pentidionis agamae TaxID=3110435 RepID=UPI002FD153A1